MNISKHTAEHAVSELLQMGYTVDAEGALHPPTELSDHARKFFGVRRAGAFDPDGERYRYLRSLFWSDGPMCVVMNPKVAVKLGHECPFGELLDAKIDAARGAATATRDLWEALPGYLIDNCEGEPVTEEMLQRAVEAMLKDPRFVLPAVPVAGQPAEPSPADPIRGLLQAHEDLIEQGENYAYFELAYTRRTGWMAWLTDRPASGEPGTAEYAKSRKVIARGQGDSAEEACQDALDVMAAPKGYSNG